MLKIRISGKLHELEEVIEQIKDGKITQHKHKNGHKTYAIDSKISVKDFLDSQQQEEITETHNEKMKKVNKELNDDLADLLQIMNDDTKSS